MNECMHESKAYRSQSKFHQPVIQVEDVEIKTQHCSYIAGRQLNDYVHFKDNT